jgi:hypothetical protein
MSNNFEVHKNQIKATVHLWLGAQIVTPDEIAHKVEVAITALSLDITPEEAALIRFEIESERVVKMDPGTVIVSEGHEPWLENRSGSISWTRWDAYRNLLSGKGITPTVLDSMHLRNAKILDLAGDPEKQGDWKRRGLVIGDVQSGKTSNYIALFNKAADAGYKVFILLAGHTDKLRQQTQIRIDEGFIGQDTKKWVNSAGLGGIAVNTKIGIGINPAIKTNFQTTVLNDFSVNSMGTGSQIDGNPTPVIFVVKKNKKILENLTSWLKNHAAANGKISAPMMLLDDEADFASINTRRADLDPTAINSAIRNLLAVFERNSYVGFTATPFANVLIDDEQEDDLFPRNFIYSLGSPSNYFGPIQMFETTDDGENHFLVPIEDAEDAIPFQHKSKDKIHELPSSLVDAVRAFFLANAVRDLRGQNKAPRSMLINASRWVKVHDQLLSLVEDTVSNLRDLLTFDKKESGSEWAELRRVFEGEFSNIPETWSQVEGVIRDSIAPIRTMVVNSSKKSVDWETVFESETARVIAIGGDVLARGLTLEGLTVSYFYRRSLAYDTLMQMGRWFGYRDGYRDVCRLWIDDEVSLWYRDISDALEELRDDLQEMARRGLEPKDFGLAVRCHPGALLMVTSRNKSLAAKISKRTVSVSNISKETSRLEGNPSIIKENWEALKSLLNTLEQQKDLQAAPNGNRLVWHKVDQSVVADFLDGYKADPIEPIFSDGALAKFTRSNMSKDLLLWDIALFFGSGKAHTDLPGGSNTVERAIKVKPAQDSDILYVSGANRRLGGRTDLGVFLSPDQIAEIESALAPGALAGPNEYRNKLKRPVLVLYPISPSAKVADPGAKPSKHYATYAHDKALPPLVGINVSFPSGQDPANPEKNFDYLVGKVWQRLNKVVLMPVVDEDEEEELDE